MAGASPSPPCPFRRGFAWYSYRRQEKKFLASIQHVTIDPANLGTWGEGYADMLRSIGDDVDSFFREIVNCGARGCSPASLGRAVRGKPSGEWDVRDYRSNIEPYYELSKNELAIPFGLSGVPVLKPFDSFDTTSPGWWTAYNHVKHDYYNTMREATLGNVLGALGGLLLLNALHKCSQHYLVLTGNLVGGLRIKNIEQRVNPNYLAAVLDKSCTGLPASHRDVSSSWLTTEVFQFRMRSDRSS